MSEQKKVRVLLADDEAHIRTLMKTVFNSIGCEVVAEAKNGQEAVDLYVQHKPNMALLDINMPFKDGVQALQEIRATDPNAFVIMLTSVSTMETVEQCVLGGAAGYIRKDTPIAEIKKIVKETWLERVKK